jgi:aminoglycoside phosphotransferase (APT) family kinase protein
MPVEDVQRRLASWLTTQMPGCADVRIEELDRVDFGYSAETLLLTVAWEEGGAQHREPVVLRLRPPTPGLLEPYDLKLQFDILRALEPTPVRAPRARWHEPTGDVLGREFYVMERLGGTVYEQGLDELDASPEQVRRMSESMIDQLAAIHTVDLGATGLDSVGDGHDHLDRELDRWSGEVHRVQRGPLPALERLASELRLRQPAPHPVATLVHGDAKPGNFAFEGGEVSAVFDWELATVGDPLTDIGWAEIMWSMPGSFTTLPGSLDVEAFVARWEELTGLRTREREWYRALNAFKMAVILLVGAMHFDQGLTDDPRIAMMGLGVSFLTERGLQELGIDEPLEHGPNRPSPERMATIT